MLKKLEQVPARSCGKLEQLTKQNRRGLQRSYLHQMNRMFPSTLQYEVRVPNIFPALNF